MVLGKVGEKRVGRPGSGKYDRPNTLHGRDVPNGIFMFSVSFLTTLVESGTC